MVVLSRPLGWQGVSIISLDSREARGCHPLLCSFPFLSYILSFFSREGISFLRERQMVVALSLLLGRQEWSSSPYILERRGMASHALMFLFCALLSFLLEKQIVATLSLLPERQGVAILSRIVSYPRLIFCPLLFIERHSPFFEGGKGRPPSLLLFSSLLSSPCF